MLNGELAVNNKHSSLTSFLLNQVLAATDCAPSERAAVARVESHICSTEIDGELCGEGGRRRLELMRVL